MNQPPPDPAGTDDVYAARRAALFAADGVKDLLVYWCGPGTRAAQILSGATAPTMEEATVLAAYLEVPIDVVRGAAPSTACEGAGDAGGKVR